MSRLDYKVHPVWKMLTEHYSFEEAFEMFGPYAGAGIKIRDIDEYTVESYMSLRPNNTNYVGTHFGGSLYSMCDPFYMFILLRHFGTYCMVWDKGASIEFKRPGTGTVSARFHIPKSEIDEIHELLKSQKKEIRHYQTDILGEDGTVVASVKKELYIRKLKKP